MTFHTRRFAATRNVKDVNTRLYLKEGALTLNLWNSMPKIEIGSVGDDWNAVGADLRKALSQYADENG